MKNDTYLKIGVRWVNPFYGREVQIMPFGEPFGFYTEETAVKCNCMGDGTGAFYLEKTHFVKFHEPKVKWLQRTRHGRSLGVSFKGNNLDFRA